MWPLNIRLRPRPAPCQRPITLARPSSTSCHVTARPIAPRPRACTRPCRSSSPVGLGMLMTSQPMATISSSRTSARMLQQVRACARQLRRAISALACQAKIVGVGAQFLVAVLGDQEIVLQAQAAAARPINSRLDGQHHILASSCRARPDARMGARGRAPRRHGRRDATAARDIRLRRFALRIRRSSSARWRAVAGAARCLVEIFSATGREAGGIRREFARTKVLGQVGPIAVSADPNFHQRRLMLLDRAVAGGGEGCDPLARPDQREGPRHLHLALVADAARRGCEPSIIAATSLSFMPGRMCSLANSMPSAASSLASRMRSISCAVLMARTSASSGVASTTCLAPASKCVEVSLRVKTSARRPCDRRTASQRSSMPTRRSDCALAARPGHVERPRICGGRGSVGS